MKKGFIIAGIILLVIGTAFIICSLILTDFQIGGFPFSNIIKNEFESKTFSTTEYFNKILIDAKFTDIDFVIKNEGVKIDHYTLGQIEIPPYPFCKIEYEEQKNIKYNISVTEGLLTVSVEDNRSWIDHIGIAFKAPKMTIYLNYDQFDIIEIQNSTGSISIPDYVFAYKADIKLSTGNINISNAIINNLKIETSTGNIKLENLKTKDAKLQVTTGTIKVDKTQCESIFTVDVNTGLVEIDDLYCGIYNSTGKTGKLVMKDVIARESFNIERTTGDIQFEKCDANEMHIKATTGDIKGSFLTEKLFKTNTNTGKVEVQSSVKGGICEISTSTGDIKITIEK